jgi:hypothetical protein
MMLVPDRGRISIQMRCHAFNLPAAITSTYTASLVAKRACPNSFQPMPTLHRLPAWLGAIFTARQPPLDDYKLLPTNSASSDHFLVDGEVPIEQETLESSYRRDQRSPQRQHGKPRRQPFSVICALGVKRTCLPRITLRRFLYCLFLTPFILALGVLLSGVPPTYEDIRTYERLLPQHNITRAKEEGHKYLKFRGQLWGHGLNNILQETCVA